jgi:hypothetical protein
MPSFTARGTSSSSHAVPPKPHRRPVALFPPDSEDELEYDLPGLVSTKQSAEKAPAAPSSNSDEEDNEQNESDNLEQDDEDEENHEEEDAVTKKASCSKGRAGATNLTPTQWAVIVSTE